MRTDKTLETENTEDFSNGARTAGFAHPSRNVGAFGLQHGMKVADFGSGSGAYVLAIAERLGNTGHIYAIDVQRDLLRRIQNDAQKRGFKNVEIIWNDLERPMGSHLAEAQLDLVLVSNLLFQIEAKRHVFAEAWRVLKPTGKLVIIDWSDSFRGLGPQKSEVVTKSSTMSLANDNGFEYVKEFDAGAHHYGLIFRPTTKKEII